MCLCGGECCQLSRDLELGSQLATLAQWQSVSGEGTSCCCWEWGLQGLKHDTSLGMLCCPVTVGLCEPLVDLHKHHLTARRVGGWILEIPGLTSLPVTLHLGSNSGQQEGQGSMLDGSYTFRDSSHTSWRTLRSRM